MPDADVSGDQLALIKVDGMHCHKCEQAIRKSIMKNAGVHEVEVDFLSGQVSVLFDRAQIAAPQLMEAITAAGYVAQGLTLGQADRAHP